MLNYAKTNRKEWTNNGLERYHQRLQQKLTKNPSMQLFFNEIQAEEKYFLDRYFECLKYGNPNNKHQSKKIRKNIDREPLQQLTVSLEKEIGCETKKFKMNQNTLNVPQKPISINIPKTPLRIEQKSTEQYTILPWIKWKAHSCRVDAFATVGYFVFYKDFAEAIFPPLIGPKLPNESHPVGALLNGIHNASTITMVQKSVENYVSYRSKLKGEKPGKGAPISTLFSEFKGLPHFTWKMETKSKCIKCKKTQSRSYDCDPLFAISSSSLIANSGSISAVIKEEVFGNYLITCKKDGKETVVEKKITFYPNYLCCILDYSEDFCTWIYQWSKYTRNYN